VINTEYSGPDLGLATGEPEARTSHLINRSEPFKKIDKILNNIILIC
jgi:hypothetical protein